MRCTRLVFGLFVLLILSACTDSKILAPVENRSQVAKINTEHYRVEDGDTLYSIAWGVDLDYRQLAQINHLKAPYALHPGQVLIVKLPSLSLAHLEKPSALPKSRAKKSKKGRVKLEKPVYLALARPKNEKKSSIKSTHKKANVIKKSRDLAQVSMPGQKRVSAPLAYRIKSGKTTRIYEPKKPPGEKNEHKERKDLIFAKKCVHCSVWPVRGELVKGFSSGQLGNKGIDIAGVYGQPIKACESGVVVYSGSGLRGYGNLIIIKHNASLLSAYAHNSELIVTEGSKVKAGQEIALMGRAPSGKVMLHFEIRRDGKPVNPLQYLR